MLIYSSPWLIAVSHVLLRLLMPRHSPYALCNLNLLFSYFALSFAISFYRFGCLFFYHPLVAKLQFLTFFLGKTNFYLFLLLSQYLFVCFIRFSMIICNHSSILSSMLSATFCVFTCEMKSFKLQAKLADKALRSQLCRVVGLDGFEPSTSRLSGARSNHLSYRPWWR